MIYFRCDTCGVERHQMEFVETIEEMLCQWCASGIDEDDNEWGYGDDGMEEGFDDQD